MRLNAMRFFSTFFGLCLLTLPCLADEQNLACIRTIGTGKLEVRTVLVGDEEEHVPLRRSSSDNTILKLNKYAVVIQLIPGEGNLPAQEKWDVLDAKGFRLTKKPVAEGFTDEWKFTVLASKKDYDCSANEEARANPAVSRSN